ncbi:O-methyltransferase [Propioniciclava soli]|uniref:Class I SAM-dependent methyltransferase n=1 Tax=Propioniciclava soli TaxID=2775081 RepID=A0ABZ3C6B0_9ACTN
MNAAANTTSATGQVASLVYADAFGAEPEHTAAARDAARSLGIAAATPGTAALLALLARMVGARAAVEIGTGAGVSGLALLAGMEPDGILTSIDLEPEHQAAARKAIASAGVPNRRARLIAGAGLAVLPKLSDGAYDFVFVDGDPLEYVEYVEQAARLLRSGGLLVVNHALAGGTVADSGNEDDETVIIREALAATQTMEEFTPVLLPVGDGLLVALRT